ncbi:MAG: amidase [Pseudomonadota bacterium]
MDAPLSNVSATRAAEAIREGRLTSVDLVNACLDRIDATDHDIHAWEYLDEKGALARAEELDQMAASGAKPGPLHGIPIGLKDIIDTGDMPTENGSAAYAGRWPLTDAACVKALRSAGAVVLGKTKTTELAYMFATDTRNPHDPGRTPGGSSSGSAAAVAAGHVPLAMGSQTGGSIIRPAAFCGVVGYKPSRDMIPTEGVLCTSKTLDHLGVFARTLEDTAFLAGVLRDPAHQGAEPLQDASWDRTGPTPRLCWIDYPFLDLLEPDAHADLRAILDKLGGHVTRLRPDDLPDTIAAHHTIYDYELNRNLGHLSTTHPDDLSDTAKSAFARGARISDHTYAQALAERARAQEVLGDLLEQFDAAIGPAAPGVAPAFGPGTGNSVFCRTYSLTGFPSLTIPLQRPAGQLPLGLQITGGAAADDALLATAAAIQRLL